MKKLVIILVILVLIFGGLSAWAVNVYAKPLEIGELKVVVIPDKGGVFVKSGEGEFQKVTGEVDLKKGDTVKTDETGSARIVLFDTNEVTLDNNSEVVIEESFIDEETPFLTKIKLNLKQGQIWNRLLELLHPDAYFEVESGGVVATVRGTIFNMSNVDGDIGVSVIESSVALKQAGETEAAQTLQADEELIFNSEKIKDLREAKIEKITEKIKGGMWFKNNFLRDGTFREFIKERRDKILGQVGPLPGSRFYPAKNLGERIASLLTFDKTARAEKIRNFQARKFLAARMLRAQGDKIGAGKILKSISNLKEIMPVVRRLEYYDRDFLKTEAQILKNGMNGDFAKEYLGNLLLPRQLEFINQKLELKPLILPKTEDLIIEPLDTNTNSTFLNINTNTSANTNEPQGPVCGDGICEIGEGSGVCDADCPPPPPPPTVIGLEISALPSSVPAQGSSKLTAVTVWSDGSKKDVTGELSWTVSQSATGASMGYVSAGMFYSGGPAGTASIKGHYDDPESGLPLEAFVSVQVTAASRK